MKTAKSTIVQAKKLPTEPKDRQNIQVISRAASILRALEKNTDGLSLGEIAKLVDLPRSTVQRIVDALSRENLLIASSATGGVRLGPALLAFAAAARFQMADMARETLKALAKETGETVDLAIRDQDKVVFIDQVSGSHRLMAVSAIGVSFPLHCCANGKAILASLDEMALNKVKKRLTLAKQTKNTFTSWTALEKELDKIRVERIAFDREENSIGICAVATALRSPSGEVATISIPVPTQRFLLNEAALAKTLLHHCDLLQRNMNPY